MRPSLNRSVAAVALALAAAVPFGGAAVAVDGSAVEPSQNPAAQGGMQDPSRTPDGTPVQDPGSAVGPNANPNANANPSANPSGTPNASPNPVCDFPLVGALLCPGNNGS